MQDPALPPGLEGASLGLLIGAARRRIKQVVWNWLGPLGLTPQQFWILLVLHESGPMSLHELAERIWADDPTACRVVRTLTDRGLLRSDADPTHGRRRLIRLDAEGRRMAPGLADLARSFRGGLEEGLAPAELLRLKRSLRHVLQNLDRLEASGQPAGSLSAELP